MNKKLVLLAILFTVLCSLFTLTGCYEPDKEDLKTFEERGWIPTTEAEIKNLAEFKERAGIPEDAKIENVSMYGGEVSRVVVYGELKEWENYKGETGKHVEARKVKIFDEEGKEIRTDVLWKPTSISGTLVAKDNKGNVTAYKTPALDNRTEKIVFLDESGKIEKERKLIYEDRDEKGFWQGENIYLSGDGQYMMVNRKSGRGLESEYNKYKYVDRAGNLLWEIEGGLFGFDDLEISNDGSRIVIINQQGKYESGDSGLEKGVCIFDKNGEKIFKYLFNPKMKSAGILSIDNIGNYIVVIIYDRSSGVSKLGYLHINVDEGKAFISEKKTK